MVLSVCLSNLKQKYEEVLAEIGVKNTFCGISLAIWEQLKNIEHRPAGTEATIIVIQQKNGHVIITRNQVTSDEIQRHLARDILSETEQLMLEDHRGEMIISKSAGAENYHRYLDPWTLEMVTRLFIPTGTN